MKKQFIHSFADMVSIENLLQAWQEFIRGKRGKKDVQEFQLRLMDNICALHEDLRNKSYKHGGYRMFRVCDPKPRTIHKAMVRDRLLHHAIHRKLYPFFEKLFIADSFSCQVGKGTHRALNRFRDFGRKASHNNTRTVWILKCDIRKFFENIDHRILSDALREHISEPDLLWLLGEIIGSFSAGPDRGLPLGNLTSQLFANIYMNQLDQFAKHKLKAKYYIRYADDFVIFSENRAWLERQVELIREFLHKELKLELHPNKVFIKTLASGVDFLGWVHFPDHRVLRTATKRRMLKTVAANPNEAMINSYLGLLRHGNARKLKKAIMKYPDFIDFIYPSGV